MKLIALLLAAWSFAPAFAELPATNPITYSRVRSGELMFPAAYCPGVSKRYEDLTDQLQQLKTSILKTAKNCTNEKLQVDGFSQLVDKGRGEFWALVTKGRGERLTPEETAKLTGYIDAVTKAGGTLIDLTMGSSCFKDDNKSLITVDVVASLINESTQALSTVIGPYGPAVTMGGKLTSSLILSIDKVARSRKAYDFDDADQRKVFIKTVCAYNGFRRSLDEISRPDSAIRDNRHYRDALATQLKRLENKCPECKTLSAKYDKEFHSVPNTSRPSLQGIVEKYEKEITAIDSVYAERVGLATVRNLFEIDSTADELKRLNDLLSDLGDIERDRVVTMQDVIEDFLFTKWLPKFINHQSKELSKRYNRLYGALWQFNENLGWEHLPQLSMEKLISQLYDPEWKPIVYFDSPQALASWRISMQAEVTRRLGEIVSGLQIIEKTCQFVRSAGVRYEGGMSYSCDFTARESLINTYSLLWNLLQTTHNDSPLLETAFEVPSPILLEWAASKKIQLPKADTYVWTANWTQTLIKLLELAEKTPDAELFLKR